MSKKVKKYLIILILSYIFFQITIGIASKKIELFFAKENRIELINKTKSKIILEMKKGIEKDKIFSENDRETIRIFFKKVIEELNM